MAFYDCVRTLQHTLNNTVAKEFNQMAPPAQTITVALDMSKAFDTVNTHTLIGKLLQTSTPGTVIKFVVNYIKGRKAYTTFRNHNYIQCQVKADPCTVTTADIKANMCDIHTSIVSRHLAARDNNKILRTHPPQVSSTEENLPRHTRRTLAQLRTNKSPFLLSYLHKIDASTHPSPLCSLCRTHEHTTQQLFSCPQIPTTLSALDLWRDPSGIAALLDDWREKLAANPHKTTEADSPQ